jgi:two-component system, OmpR family, response regulator ResD
MARVLVVEDDDDVRQVVTGFLSREGHDTEEAASGEEAIARLREEGYDLLVLDVMLGPVSGWHVLEELNRSGIRSRVKVLALTARRSERDFMDAWRLGVDQYLTKPFEADTFLGAVQDVLARTPEQLAARRKAELDKAELLYRLESAFEGRRPPPREKR